jgi:hypothetical protein
MLMSTAVGEPLKPAAVNVTSRAAPGEGPHPLPPSGIAPTPVPGNVAAGALTSGGVVNESALATVVVLLSVAE